MCVAQPAGPETLSDPVQVARRKEHSDYIREQLKYLEAHIWVPSPEGVFLWSRPQQTEVGYSMNEPNRSNATGASGCRSAGFCLQIDHELVHVYPSIERTEDWKLLRAHLDAGESPTIMEDYFDWVASLGQFFSKCSEVLSKVVAEANKRIDEAMKGTPGWQGVKMVSRWAEHGVHRWFYEDIYSLAFDRRASDEEQYAVKPMDSGPGFFGLWKPGTVLAVGTRAEARVYSDVHKTLREEKLDWAQTASLLGMHEQCAEKGQALRRRLDIVEKRGTSEAPVTYVNAGMRCNRGMALFPLLAHMRMQDQHQFE